MAINLSDNIQTSAPKPTDSRYLCNLVPYTSVSQVNTVIPLTGCTRYTGLTVNILGVEYWYKNGVADACLIVKAVSDTITGATNGLSVSGNNIVLGGTLTGNTIICTTGQVLCINDTCASIGIDSNSITIFATGGTFFNGGIGNVSAIGLETVGMSVSAPAISVATSGGAGIEYVSNYSAGYSARSLVDKEYVDNTVTGSTSSGITTANNGLTKVGQNVSLGGTLTGDTIIDTSTYNLCFCGTSGITIICNCAIILSSSGSTNINSAAAVTIGDSVTPNAYICSNNFLIECTSQYQLDFTTCAEIIDQAVTPRGLVYSADYGATFCNRSLVDKQYVDNSITASTLTFNNGLTKIGNIVSLGGTLTGATTINLNTNSLTFNNGSIISSGATGQGFDSYNDYKLSGQTFLSVPTRNFVNGNIALGFGALSGNTTGALNTAFGFNALCCNSTGSYNIALGVGALCNNSTGCGNTALGLYALRCNICGSLNVGIGFQALFRNTCGTGNVGIGSCVLINNTCGCNNVGIGCAALNFNSLGNSNTAIGSSALGTNVSGSSNVVIGSSALGCNVSGSSNVAIGGCALNKNVSGSSNVAIGTYAGYCETSSNKLHITNQITVNPLIYGDFALKCIKINGNLIVTGNTGIGITAPLYKLDVCGNIAVGGVGCALYFDTTGVRAANSIYTSDNYYLNIFAGRGDTSKIQLTNSTGILFHSCAAERMRINNVGNVGIGTSAPTCYAGYTTLEIGNGGVANKNGLLILTSCYTAGACSAQIYQAGANGDLLFNVNPSLTGMKISQTGVVTITNLASGSLTSASGVITSSSDENLKIADGYIDDALSKVMQLKPRYFYWNEKAELNTKTRQLGFYAQEVNQALGEEVANTPEKGKSWGIYDRGIIAMLTKAIQEQQLQINKLGNTIEELKNK